MWQRWMVVHKIVLTGVVPVLRWLPFRLAHWFLGVMGRLDLMVVPNQARLYEKAVADGARRLGCRWDVQAVSRSLARQTYRWRVRDRLLEGMSDARVNSLFHVTGREGLDAALASGKGVILLANHFGAHVAISHWMFRAGYPLRWFGERPRNVSEYLKRHLESDGPLGQSKLFVSRKTPMNEAASTIVQLARILNAGMVVKVACDVRWRGGKVTPARFLGQSETFASTWVNLAAKTGAAVIQVFCRLDDTGIYHLDFQPSFPVPPDAARGAQAGRWVQRALSAVEEQVRLHPEQSNDYFFWEPLGDRPQSYRGLKSARKRAPAERLAR
jgi:phosphatidylinositol dimannoside acyltransferase